MVRKLVILFLIAMVGAAILAVMNCLIWTPVRQMERTAHKMIGRPEAELIKVLGPPRYVVSSASLAGRTVDYPWKEMNYIPVPNHPVRNKVLLYSILNFAFYIYVDENGIIEYVATAST